MSKMQACFCLHGGLYGCQPLYDGRSLRSPSDGVLLGESAYEITTEVKGTIVASTSHDAILQVGKRQRVHLQRWSGGVKVEGVVSREFQRDGFAALAVGSKVEVRGWYLERDIVLVEFLRVRQRANKP